MHTDLNQTLRVAHQRIKLLNVHHIWSVTVLGGLLEDLAFVGAERGDEVRGGVHVRKVAQFCV